MLIWDDRRAADYAQKRQRMRRFLFVNENIFIGLFERREAARARANDRGGALAILEGCFKARLPDGFVGGGARILRKAIGQHDGLAFAALSRVEIANLASDLDIEVLQGEAFDGTDPMRAGFDGVPEFLDARADARHDAHARDGDAAPLAVQCHDRCLVLRAG